MSQDGFKNAPEIYKYQLRKHFISSDIAFKSLLTNLNNAADGIYPLGGSLIGMGCPDLYYIGNSLQQRSGISVQLWTTLLAVYSRVGKFQQQPLGKSVRHNSLCCQLLLWVPILWSIYLCSHRAQLYDRRSKHVSLRRNKCTKLGVLLVTYLRA